MSMTGDWKAARLCPATIIFRAYSRLVRNARNSRVCGCAAGMELPRLAGLRIRIPVGRGRSNSCGSITLSWLNHVGVGRDVTAEGLRDSCELAQRGLQVLDDFLGNHLGRQKAVGV